jgi:hypothetical protein
MRCVLFVIVALLALSTVSAQTARVSVTPQQKPYIGLYTSDVVYTGPGGSQFPVNVRLFTNLSIYFKGYNTQGIESGGFGGVAVLFWDSKPTQVKPPGPYPAPTPYQNATKFSLCAGSLVTLYDLGTRGKAQLYIPPMCGGVWNSISEDPGNDNIQFQMWSTMHNAVNPGFQATATLTTFTASKQRIVALQFTVVGN